MNILAVCTHNYFRSQIVEWLLRARAPEGIVIRSAGCASAYLGHKAFPLVLNAINTRGGHCDDYQAHQITIQDVQWADLILCAEQMHVDFIKEKFIPLTRIQRFLPGSDIPDGGVENPPAVELAADMIYEGIKEFCKEHGWK